MRTRLDVIHSNMIQRCSNPNHPYYGRYGGRGITVCPEWKSRKEFRSWALKNGYDETLTLDRINNDKGYSPDNCRWVSLKTNCNNRSSSHKIEAFGECHSLLEWSEKLGISYNTLKKRVCAGERDNERLLRPSLRKKEVIYV